MTKREIIEKHNIGRPMEDDLDTELTEQEAKEFEEFCSGIESQESYEGGCMDLRDYLMAHEPSYDPENGSL